MDPVTFEVLATRWINITEEMAPLLEIRAPPYLHNIRPAADVLVCALFHVYYSKFGRCIAQSFAQPAHSSRWRLLPGGKIRMGPTTRCGRGDADSSSERPASAASHAQPHHLVFRRGLRGWRLWAFGANMAHQLSMSGGVIPPPSLGKCSPTKLSQEAAIIPQALVAHWLTRSDHTDPVTLLARRTFVAPGA